MSEQSEKPKDYGAIDHQGEKASLREGDSPRARAFRAKDEAFDWSMEDVRVFSSKNPDGFKKFVEEGISPCQKAINDVMENPEDEDASNRMISAVKTCAAKAHELGIPGCKPNASEKPAEES